MLKSLLKFIFFEFPIVFLSGLKYIIFENADILCTEFQMDDRSARQHSENIRTLENIVYQEGIEDNG